MNFKQTYEKLIAISYRLQTMTNSILFDDRFCDSIVLKVRPETDCINSKLAATAALLTTAKVNANNENEEVVFANSVSNAYVMFTSIAVDMQQLMFDLYAAATEAAVHKMLDIFSNAYNQQIADIHKLIDEYVSFEAKEQANMIEKGHGPAEIDED